jgi:hypothetical protein
MIWIVIGLIVAALVAGIVFSSKVKRAISKDLHAIGDWLDEKAKELE